MDDRELAQRLDLLQQGIEAILIEVNDLKNKNISKKIEKEESKEDSPTIKKLKEQGAIIEKTPKFKPKED